MKRLRLAALAAALILTLFGGNALAASGCTVASTVVDRYEDSLGEHAVIRITVTQTGTTFSFTSGDLTSYTAEAWKGYVYWIGIDATGTLDAAPQLTVTDKWSFTQFSDTSSWHVSNPVKVTGNSYDGQYLHLTAGQTWSFNDVGDGEVLTIYLDVVR